MEKTPEAVLDSIISNKEIITKREIKEGVLLFYKTEFGLNVGYITKIESNYKDFVVEELLHRKKAQK